jgi:2',3'-cyclic-nucleotide 2'-phosphodiesterase (5'-nucleotidase family)
MTASSGKTLVCIVAVWVASCKTERPLALAEASASGGTWSPARTAEIYFSTGVAGYVEPCGCTSKPLGGLQRLATVVKGGHKNRALVDAGDLFFGPEKLDELSGDQHRLKARILARVYRQLGAVALNLGPSDLAGGAELLRDMQREGAVPLVSANVRPVLETGPSIAQSFVREIGGIKIGFTGVATPERFSGIAGVSPIEYAPAVRSELVGLRKRGAEVVIVLADVGEGGARDLANAVPEIDLILRAPGTPIGQRPLAPEQVGGVIIAEAGSQGQHVGKITLKLDRTAPAHPLALDDGGEKTRRARALTERKIRAYRQEIETWRKDPSKQQVVRAKEEQIARLEATLKEDGSETQRRVDGAHVAIEIIALADSIPSDAGVSEVLAAYYSQLKDMNAAKGDVSKCEQKSGSDPKYVGTARCATCHEPAFRFWKQTKHAAAWATLEQQGKHFDLTCVGCHTIGFQRPGGFCRLADVGELKDVGCENCHGPGSAHASTGDRNQILLAAGESTCSGCHVPEHSDTFDYETYLLRITGEGHRARSLKR